MSQDQIRLALLGVIAVALVALNVQVYATFGMRRTVSVEPVAYSDPLTAEQIANALSKCRLTTFDAAQVGPDRLQPIASAYSLQVACEQQQ